MVIHGLVTLTDQEFLDEEMDLSKMSIRKTMKESDNLKRRMQRREIAKNQFDYLYKKKIEPLLDEPDKFLF